MNNKPDPDDDTMRDEYDFSNGVRGKYVERLARGTNIVKLDPDMAELFKDSASVNEALRVLVKLARQQAERIAP
jgi:hypothetical protein